MPMHSTTHRTSLYRESYEGLHDTSRFDSALFTPVVTDSHLRKSISSTKKVICTVAHDTALQLSQ